MRVWDLIRMAQYLKKHVLNPNFKFCKNFKTKYQNSELFKKIIKLNIKNDQKITLLILILPYLYQYFPYNKLKIQNRLGYLSKKLRLMLKFKLFGQLLKYLLVKLIVNLFNLEVKNLNIDNRFVNLKTLCLS